MNVVLNEICIRNATTDDCKQLADWWNDGKVMAHAGFPNGLGITPEEIEHQLLSEDDYKGRTLIIEHNSIPIGEMNYHRVNENTAEIGIKICDFDYQGKGLGPIILSMFIKELFTMGYTRIVLDTNLKNERAQHVYEQLGFRKLRVNIDEWEDQLGVPQSSVDYELTPELFQDYSLGSIATPEMLSSIKLSEITEENWMDVADLSVKESQKNYVAPAIGIIARGYVYRDCKARIFVIENNGTIVGVALVREFTEEPLGYDLQQFMIDQRHQGKGYGSAALKLILDELRKEAHYDHVELCVKKDDIEAIQLYEKHGFVDSGYVDEDMPDSLNMTYTLF